MKHVILAAALTTGFTFALATPAQAAPRNWDCSKPGNANKSACKGKAAAPPAAAKAAPAPKAATAKPATVTKSVSRTYDCTKAGNANKAQCKSSTSVTTSVAKPASAPAAQPSMFQRMKNALTSNRTAPAPAAKPSARKSAGPASVEDHNPAGAIAQCKDGTYSHAKGRSGACARHGGVAKWS